MPLTHEIVSVPFPLESSEPWPWAVGEDSVAARAKPRSDIFVDPENAAATVNAVTLMGEPSPGDFTLEARVRVGFQGQFDAGVLLLWRDSRTWAKLCFEYSPDGHPMVVSVVCRDVADDCNSFTVDGDSVWLRIGRRGAAFTMHASHDGRRWELVRHFALGDQETPLSVGFEVQSPMADGCDVEFEQISFRQRTVPDIRDGS